jgi:hypothetical protein
MANMSAQGRLTHQSKYSSASSSLNSACTYTCACGDMYMYSANVTQNFKMFELAIVHVTPLPLR